MERLPLRTTHFYPNQARSQSKSSQLGTGSPIGHTHLLKRAISRREFLRVAGIGSLGLGAALLLRQGIYAWEEPCVLAKPVPGGIQPLGPGTAVYHVHLPSYPPLGNPDPSTNDPSIINDFNGLVGLAYVQGMGTHTDKGTGETRHLPFDVDLRFMKGEYAGVDGKNHHGAFAFI